MDITSFHINIEDSSGNVLGSGPITSAGGWRYTARMDRAGSFNFSMPVSDDKAELVQKKRIARAYALIGNVWTECGAGVIDSIEVVPNPDGTALLHVSGDGEERQLTYRSVGFLEIASAGSSVTHSSALTSISAFSPSGWTFNADTSPPHNSVYGVFAGEKVLTALIWLAQKSQTHFCRSAAKTLTFASSFPDSNVRAIQAFGNLASGTCAITNLTQRIDTFDLITRIYPFGAGNGRARLTLAATSESAPTGFTLDAVNNFIESDSATADYGRIEDWVEFKDISPVSNTDADLQAAANMLFAVSLEELKRRSTELEQATYTLQLAQCDALLRPLQTIRVSFHDPDAGLDIEDDLNILESTIEINAQELQTTSVVVSTADRWPVTDETVLGESLAEGLIFQAHPQLNVNSYTTSYNKLVDETETAAFRFRFGSEVVQLQQVLFEFQILPLESSVKTIGTETGGAEVDTGGPSVNSTNTAGVTTTGTGGPTTTGSSGPTTTGSGGPTTTGSGGGANTGGTAVNTNAGGNNTQSGGTTSTAPDGNDTNLAGNDTNLGGNNTEQNLANDTVDTGSGVTVNTGSGETITTGSGVTVNTGSGDTVLTGPGETGGTSDVTGPASGNTGPNDGTTGEATGSTGTATGDTGTATGDTGGPSNNSTGDPIGGDIDGSGNHRHQVNIVRDSFQGDGGQWFTLYYSNFDQRIKTSDASGGTFTTSTAAVDAFGAHTHSLSSHAHSLNNHEHSLGGHAHSMNNHDHSLGGHVHSMNSHAHSLGDHSHSLGNHTHTIGPHTHSIGSHTHSIGLHTHSIGPHTHSIGQHTHTVATHSHVITTHQHAIVDHFHTITNHSHTIDTHTHAILSHTHTVSSHTHTTSAHTHSIATHTHSIATHTHGLSQHTHSLSNHTHSLTDSIVALYGIFRESLANTFAITDLEYQVNSGGWSDLSGATDIGSDWWRLDVTSAVQNTTTFRPSQESNLLEIRRKTAGATDKTAQIDALLSVRNIIQAIAYV